MIEPFSYATHAARVVFGRKSLDQIPDQVDRLGVSRVLLVATPGRVNDLSRLRGMLGTRVAGSFDGAKVHVPAEVLDSALKEARRSAADAALALGGGSAIGLAKALALHAGLRVIAVPTTYAGSEMTSVWGLTTGTAKQTGRDPAVAPVLVVYDPELTATLPAKTSATSGLNAMAHCVEALYAPDASPMSDLLAAEGLRLLAAALPRVADHRETALLGAHFAGSALELTSMGLEHRLAHVLGGLGLPHALTHAILLPHVVRFNAAAAPKAMDRIAGILGATDAASGIEGLLATLDITERLRDIGLRHQDINPVAETVVRASGLNPAPVSTHAVRELLRQAL